MFDILDEFSHSEYTHTFKDSSFYFTILFHNTVKKILQYKIWILSL